MRAFAEVLERPMLGRFGPRRAAIAEYAAEIGPPARAVRGFLTSFLESDQRVRGIAWDQRWQALARRALARIDDRGP